MTPKSGEALPDHSATPDMRSLTAKVADELRLNDECGSREPLIDDEYMDDAAAILRIVSEHQSDMLLSAGAINTLHTERDRLRAENEALKAESRDLRGALQRISEMQCECTGFYHCGPCVQNITSEAEIAALQSDENGATHG